MANESIFADEWRECLQSQYQHVVRNNDQITLKSLTPIMIDVGFSDDELRELAFRATLRAEDVADDFVPDLEIMSGAQPVVKPEAPPVPDAAPPEVAPVAEAAAEVVPPEDLSSDDLGMTLEETLAVVDAALADETGVQAETLADTGEAMAADEDGEDVDEPPEPESNLPPGVQQLSLF